MLLINNPDQRIYLHMKHCIKYSVAAVGFALIASSAAAECTATYKAKQDNPLRLEQSTITVSGPCSIGVVTPKVQAALAAEGWTLLKVLSVSEN